MSTQDERTRVPGSRTAVVVGVLVVGGALAACGAQSGGDDQSSSNPGTVRAVDDSRLGRILVDAGGRTLYFADQEADGTIRCTDECLDFWFPVTGSGQAPGVPGLDVLDRPDNGKAQLTYEGKPLYTFQLDKAAGDANGNNLEDDFGGTHFVWHVVTLGDAAPSPDTGDGGGGYGGGY